MQSIAVVDYGMGNLRSVVNALQVVCDARDQVVLTSEPDRVQAADRVVFPGQGAAGDCMRAIDEYGLRAAVVEAARERPFLGICMGMQVLIEYSEENQGTDCLGFYPGRVRYFGDDCRDADGVRMKVPHMGWNRVSQTREHPLWHAIDEQHQAIIEYNYMLVCEAGLDPDKDEGQRRSMLADREISSEDIAESNAKLTTITHVAASCLFSRLERDEVQQFIEHEQTCWQNVRLAGSCDELEEMLFQCFAAGGNFANLERTWERVWECTPRIGLCVVY